MARKNCAWCIAKPVCHGPGCLNDAPCIEFHAALELKLYSQLNHECPKCTSTAIMLMLHTKRYVCGDCGNMWIHVKFITSETVHKGGK